MFKLRRQNQVGFQTTVSELVVRLIFGCLVIRREGCYKDSLEWVGGAWLLLAHVTHTLLGVWLELPCGGPPWRQRKPVATVSLNKLRIRAHA